MIAELQTLLLKKRGIETDADREAFLNPDYEKHIHDPLGLPDMEKACRRIITAIDANEHIVVYSDYDADGIPGGVILHDFFKKIKYKNFENYIPHRHDEGFGLNLEAIQGFIKSNTKVLITVDCGITDVEEVALAVQGGIDVIITDHHIPHEHLPPAYAIVNPKMSGSMYPFDMLCGAGVAWKLVQGLIKLGDFKLSIGWEKWLLDMAGIGTLSDMVPLIGENRVIAHYGLKVLRKSPRHGFMKLLSKMKINQRTLSEDDVGFMISPRINAASRMGNPTDAFLMLASEDPIEATKWAEHLITVNDERKRLTASLSKHIESIMSKKEIIPRVIVVGDVDWKPGILGLVANSIAESYKRPVFLWGRESGLLIKGSVRTGNATDVVALMKRVEHIFEGYGGHAASGGFSISHEKIDLLEGALNAAYQEVVDTKDVANEVDADIALEDIDNELVKMLESMAPYGLGNPKPLFRIRSVKPELVRGFGKGNAHLEVTLTTHPRMIKGIAFFKTQESFPVLNDARPVDIIGNIERSYWAGKSEIRVRITDIH